MKTYKYVIVGGGIVAGYAAREFANHDNYHAGELAIITADSEIPYERPPLSKKFMVSDQEPADMQINDPNFYRDAGIDIFLYTRVEQIDYAQKHALTDHGDTFAYDKLLIATGSAPNKFDASKDPTNCVQYLRTLDDANDIKAGLHEVKKAIVIGGGFIGMEAAASFAKDDIEVVMLIPESQLMEGFFTPQLSKFFEDYYKQWGVTFIKNVDVDRVENMDNKPHVILNNKDTLDSDLVLAGIGVTPNTQLAGDKLDVDDGILVNEFLETSVEGIYAAGDVASYIDLIFNKRRHVEHWQNAVDMGRFVAHSMLGTANEPFNSLRYFFSDVFDLSYEFWGETDNADTVLHIGQVDDASIGVWWLKDERVIGTFLLNRPDVEREKAQAWIRQGQVVTSKEILAFDQPIPS